MDPLIEIRAPEAQPVANRIAQYFGREGIKDAFVEMLEEVLPRITEDVQSRTPILTGTLVASEAWEVLGGAQVVGRVFVGEAIAPDGADTLDYGPVVERYSGMFQETFEYWYQVIDAYAAEALEMRARQI